ncbi:hypothetical protein DPV78_009334 [Talaromyces pinophilus]|nr:hypothetical protein DPV78_009334 [Talaromyces pinophilus]
MWVFLWVARFKDLVLLASLSTGRVDWATHINRVQQHTYDIKPVKERIDRVDAIATSMLAMSSTALFHDFGWLLRRITIFSAYRESEHLRPWLPYWEGYSKSRPGRTPTLIDLLPTGT